jgi:hypothetical protein
VRYGLLAVLLASCGIADGLELGGTIAFSVGSETVTPTTGAAIRDRDAAKELIVIGTRDISCSTTLESPLRKGTYLTILIDRAAPVPGPQDAMVSLLRVVSSGTLINGAVSTVTLETVGSRITGDLTFMTEDPDDALPLAATGTFDVVNCSP